MTKEEMTAIADRVSANILFCTKEVLTSEETARYMGISRSYLYKLTMRQEIPHFKPMGKIVYFNRTEVEQWLQSNRVGPEVSDWKKNNAEFRPIYDRIAQEVINLSEEYHRRGWGFIDSKIINIYYDRLKDELSITLDGKGTYDFYDLSNAEKIDVYDRLFRSYRRKMGL